MTEEKKEQKEQRIIFLQGQKTILRPPRKETDLEDVLRWVNDQEVTQYLTMYLPMSAPTEEAWFDRLISRENDILLAIETLDGVFVGNVGLHGINWKDRRATLGVMIGEKPYWEKGLGTDVLMILLNYAFNNLNLHKVNSAVLGFNERSLKLHLKCGFTEIGRRKDQFFKNGQYCDEILLEVFPVEWVVYWNKNSYDKL